MDAHVPQCPGMGGVSYDREHGESGLEATKLDVIKKARQ